jgi:putative ABC transport system ATP-binding protein
MLEQTGKGKGTPLVQMEKVTKRYGRAGEAATVLKDFDLEVQAGDYLAIMGRSGSGKTTLLNLLGAMDRDYEGVLRLKGREMKSLSEGELAEFRNRSVGFIFQTFNLIPHLTVLENISLPGFFRDDAPSGAEAKAQASSCLARVRLDGFGGRHPLQLSGGERQRVAIARALYQRPQIVLCDEPTGSLDADNAEQVMALFEGLNKDLGVTLIVVTHDPQVAARARRMVRIDDVGAAQEVGG